jgi:hypothetical protein
MAGRSTARKNSVDTRGIMGTAASEDSGGEVDEECRHLVGEEEARPRRT